MAEHPDDVIPEESPRGRLRARRDEILADNWIELRVPRWSKPEIWIRYKPVKVAAIEQSGQARKKSGVEDWLVLSNADVLISACLAIFELPEGAVPKEELAEEKPDRLQYASHRWESFGPELAAELDVTSTNAAEVLRALFSSTDGDVMQHSTMLSSWSNTAGLKVEELLEGE